MMDRHSERGASLLLVLLLLIVLSVTVAAGFARIPSPECARGAAGRPPSMTSSPLRARNRARRQASTPGAWS